MTSSGNKTSTQIRTEWTKEFIIPSGSLVRGASGYTIPLDLPLPADVPGTVATALSGERIDWYLSVTADLPGVDLYLYYCVPVFKPNGSSDVQQFGAFR